MGNQGLASIDLFKKHDTLRHADLIKALAAQSVIASPVGAWQSSSGSPRACGPRDDGCHVCLDLRNSQ